MSDSKNDERVALEEAALREINEFLEDRALAEIPPTHVEFVCECADSDCAERISLTIEEYEHVRERSNWAVVKAGHVVPTSERVAERRQAFWIVEKTAPVAREVYEQLDPRDGD
jgi:hypothetical protein